MKPGDILSLHEGDEVYLAWTEAEKTGGHASIRHGIVIGITDHGRIMVRGKKIGGADYSPETVHRTLDEARYFLKRRVMTIVAGWQDVLAGIDAIEPP